MRIIIIGLSIFFFTLSVLIIFRTLGLPVRNASYYDAPAKSVTKTTAPASEDALAKLAKEQEANRALVEKLQATIANLEDELTKKNEDPPPPVVETVEAEKKPVLLAVLGTGTFSSGQVVVNKARRNAIVELVPKILGAPGYGVIIEGHTSNIPVRPSTEMPYKDNMELSFLRAKAVANVLVEEGISLKRLTVIGYGDARPVATNETVRGRARNRRVEVKLVPGDRES